MPFDKMTEEAKHSSAAAAKIWAGLTDAQKREAAKETGSFEEFGPLNEIGGSTQDVLEDYVLKKYGKTAKHTARHKLGAKWKKARHDLDYEKRKHPVLSEKNLSNPIFRKAHKEEREKEGKPVQGKQAKHGMSGEVYARIEVFKAAEYALKKYPGIKEDELAKKLVNYQPGLDPGDALDVAREVIGEQRKGKHGLAHHWKMTKARHTSYRAQVAVTYRGHDSEIGDYYYVWAMKDDGHELPEYEKNFRGKDGLQQAKQYAEQLRQKLGFKDPVVMQTQHARHSAESELAMGIETEKREHGMNDAEAKKTAEDHLRENPQYYSKSKAAGLAKHGKGTQLAEKVMRISNQILDKHGATSGTAMEKEPLRTELINAVKSQVGKLDEEAAAMLENENYHTDLSILMEVGLAPKSWKNYYDYVEHAKHATTSPVNLVRDKSQEDNQVHLWFEDTKNDIVASVVGGEGDVQLRISTPKGSKIVGFVGADPEKMAGRADQVRDTAMRTLQQMGYGAAQHTGPASMPADQNKSIDRDMNAYKPKFAAMAKWGQYRKARHAKEASAEGKKLKQLWESNTPPQEIAKKMGYSSTDEVYAKVMYLKENGLMKSAEEAQQAKHSKTVTHQGPLVTITARHQKAGMQEFALIEAPFLREGWFHAEDGKMYYYPWEVIKRDMKTFQGKEFFIDHDEENGLEMGMIDKVIEKAINGVQHAVAMVKVPEREFSKQFLDRIQDGLIRYVSSTHDFKTDPEDPSRTVKSITGRALSTVREGEVAGARITGVQRKIKIGRASHSLRKAFARAWKGRGA